MDGGMFSTGEGRCGVAGMRVLSIPEHRFPILAVAISIASGIGDGGWLSARPVPLPRTAGTAHDIVFTRKGKP
jgi:hypothetical protein